MIALVIDCGSVLYIYKTVHTTNEDRLEAEAMKLLAEETFTFHYDVDALHLLNLIGCRKIVIKS
jgi:hypothetical protein